MKAISFVLNLPWTLIGFVAVLLSLPTQVSVSHEPFAFIFKVKSLWWYSWLPGQKGIRALVNGNVVQLGPAADEKDLAHELIHIRQYEREPFIHPFLYAFESLTKGYRNNKYEVEAYSKSGSRYIAN